MTAIKFNKHFNCRYGVVEQIAPQVRRIIAENPSPFTFYGTGTYIVGSGRVAVIDPGPDKPEHIDNITDALGGENISHILVTHTHLDHSPGCRLLRAHTDAPTYGYGPHGADRIMGREIVEEGADMAFTPDIRVKHGDVIRGDRWTLECVHTPGHTSNHICYGLREQKLLFSGDHVMAWSTSIISPPDGNLSDYMNSLALLLERDDRIYWPTHGPAIDNPRAFARAYLAHRQRRIDQVLTCLAGGIYRIESMLPSMYPDLPGRMHGAAARSVLSTLIYLIQHKAAAADRIDLDGTYRLL